MLTVIVQEGALSYRALMSVVSVVVAFLEGDAKVGQTLDRFVEKIIIAGKDMTLDRNNRDTGFTGVNT